MTHFRRKTFSSYVIKDAVKGAAIGGLLGGGSSSFIGGVLPGVPKFKEGGEFKTNWNEGARILNGEDKNPNDKFGNRRRLLGTSAGVVIGAALGALVGATKDISEYISGRRNLQGKLTNGIVDKLKKNWEEDINFTLNPKVADKLGTKVCFVVTRNGEGIRLLVNLKNDQKLGIVSEKILKKLKTKAQVRTQNTSDKYNEILVSTAPNTKSTDIAFISELIDNFITAGYPVYIVEVG